MRIQILGTAAAEGWPAVFCGCETCARAKAAGGHNLRSRPSIQIDDIHKIDLPPDTYYHMIRYGLDLSRLAHLFITHAHPDHLDLDEMGYLRPPFGHNLANAPIRIYGSETVARAITSRYREDLLPIELVILKPFEPVHAGSLVFTPIEARHNPDELCLNYIIQSNTATALYASDTGEYEQPTMDFLRSHKFDLLIIECTQGTLPHPATYHMSLEAVLRLRDKLVRSGSIRTIITHFSHNIGLLHEELEAIAGPQGVEVAYDGMEILSS
jgi:phosphoribosyl 1,2-cyclic phosphate phosphodiesterase